MNDSSEIRETLKAAQSYLSRLKKLNHKIQNAEEQISESSTETEKCIDAAFNNLLTKITNVLEARKRHLIAEVHKTRCQSFVPLEQCKRDICKRIEKTNILISEGEALLQRDLRSFADFREKSTALGCLPEIPELKEVPCMSFQIEQQCQLDLLEQCAGLGSVCKIAPVQISQMTEKPGAILIEWQVVENDDRFFDIQEFRLQRAFGDAFSNFFDCYVGPESQFLVKDLQPQNLYSFRVCCKLEGANEWSPWSLPQVGCTKLKSFSWQANEKFILSNENKIACALENKPTLLISNGPQFQYLEFASESSVGIIAAENSSEIRDIKQAELSHFVVDSSGEIVVDGVKKSTKLPQASKGLKICFICELIQNDRVRMNVETCNKQVTYDWLIPKNQKLFFVASLQKPNKIMVE